METRDGALRALAGRLGVDASEEQWRRLGSFTALLLRWNAHINLTGGQSAEEIYAEQLPDSVALAAVLAGGARVVDVGSGGGLPAVPLAVLRPDLRLTMVEPRAKRAAFLRTAVRELGVAADVVQTRLEAWSPGPRFDAAVSRATFKPTEWLALAGRLAPVAAVLAARGEDVGAVGEWVLERGVAYETGRRHPRWLGLYRAQ